MREIDCLGTLIELVCQERAASKSKISNDYLWFRGHRVSSRSLIPAVQRNGYKKNEASITNYFYMRASVALSEQPGSEDYAGWIALMQHYGVPTRLLDWTRSPLVAAYFATSNYEKYPNKDACIWILKPIQLNMLEYKAECNFIFPMDSKTILKRLMPAFGKFERAKDLNLHEIAHPNKILACYPVRKDNRVFAQQSAFTVHDTDRCLEDEYGNTSDESGNPIIEKIMIKAQNKERIFEELQACGITLRSVYPDAENIASEIKDFYLTD